MVGIGDGALVGLVTDAEIAGIDAHDLAGGVAGKVGRWMARGSDGRGRGHGHGGGCFGTGDLSPLADDKQSPGVLRPCRKSWSTCPTGRASASVIGGLPFWRGRIAGREAVFVETGPGKVNGGVAAALLLQRFGCRARWCCAASLAAPRSGAWRRRRRDRAQQPAARYGFDRGGLRHGPAQQPASLGDDWAPGYPLSGTLVARVREAIAGGTGQTPLRPSAPVSESCHPFRPVSSPATSSSNWGRRAGASQKASRPPVVEMGRRRRPDRATMGRDIPFVNVPPERQPASSVVTRLLTFLRSPPAMPSLVATGWRQVVLRVPRPTRRLGTSSSSERAVGGRAGPRSRPALLQPFGRDAAQAADLDAGAPEVTQACVVQGEIVQDRRRSAANRFPRV